MDYPSDFPIKDKKRAYRKARYKAAKTHARSVAKYVMNLKQDYLDYFVCRSANNLKRCSCWMCRNPRHSNDGKDSLTIQEKRVMQKDE